MAEKSERAQREEKILRFWKDNKIFEKSLEKDSPKGEFVFYDGPPFATGLPHYGHILPGTIKDIIPRYQTMRGKRGPRRWGWDCHGLPIENLVEKELGLSSKKDIEIFGVEKFNKAARNMVMRYADEWKKIIPRVGRWVDMEDDYKTMDTTYTESVWWSFKNLYDKGLIYKSFKSMHICPHCETTLSNFEINQGYKDITDISVYIKFSVVGEDDTYFLAWTTTPWTLPGNVALAINKNTTYVKVKKDGQFLIMAKDLVEKVLKENFEITEEFSGKKLLGKSYIPLFPYYDNDSLENRKNGFKIYHGDFVTTVDGTGIVHIAPAFGEDDMNLGKAEKLPFIQHVNIGGTFKKEVVDFAGQKVKPKEDHQKADVEVIKFLAKAGTLFEKEKIVHPYPHCWRCDTPLLNYATTSWFVKVSDIKDKMIELNKKILWSPKEIGEGRFGKWLEGARDWAISRSRYWGAPLPVWEDDKKELIVLGSIDELKKYTKKSGNKYLVMRHGEAQHNVLNLVSSVSDFPHHLTEKGKKQTTTSAKKLKSKKIDVIFCSPFLRTKETAQIVAKEIGFPEDKIEYDDRIRELNYGDFHLKPIDDFLKYEESDMHNFDAKLPNGESYQDAKNRIGDFITSIDAKYKSKNILIVAHGIFHEVFPGILEGADAKKSKYFMDTITPEIGGVYEYSFASLPHNENYELDLHKPFIDQVELEDEKRNKLTRIKEVLDVWFDSGAMPFAQDGLKSEKEIQYPADFISEAVDQTRGWFYTLHAIGVLMERGRSFKNVICLGHILDVNGKKMSKSLGNIVDPWLMIDKYWADALRMWMYTVNQPGDSKNFDEKTVDEVVKKVFNLSSNILSFYDLYKDEGVKPHDNSNHILDKWILTRLDLLIKEGAESLDTFEVFEAARAIRDFVGDFSTWYIRRSRDRFKSEDIKDKNNALATTHFVLLELAKYMAPFMPFFAEHIYLKLKSENDPGSVHLCDWPKILRSDEKILNNMEETRKIVSLALKKRMIAGIKVRQPLRSLKIKSERLKSGKEYFELIKDEVNVKEILFDQNMEGEVELDTEVTPELQKEGNARDFIRAIQELRKNKNLTPSDIIEILIETDETGKGFLDSVSKEIKKPTNVSDFVFQENNG